MAIATFVIAIRGEQCQSTIDIKITLFEMAG